MARQTCESNDAGVLNPVLLTEQVSGSLSAQFYDSLIALNNDTGLPEPRIAKRFE